MIRRSIIILDFANSGKKQAVISLLSEANRVINLFIDRLWSEQKFTGKFANLKTRTWLSARLQQACGKQALEIVKSQCECKLKVKPVYKKPCLNLDSRFITFLETRNSFDCWIKLGSTGAEIIHIPAKKHRHFNQFVGQGWMLKGSTRLLVRGDQIVLEVLFEKDRPVIRQDGKEIGIDIGYRKLLATSERQFHGEKFKELADKIQRKKQGSKAFKRTLIERNEFVNRTVKELPWSDLKVIAVENLKGLKNGRRFRKQFQAKFQRWTYPAVLKRLELLGEISGVHVHRVNPAFTSQTCPKCKVRDKRSRNGELFKCTACGYSEDSDYIGSLNILQVFRESNKPPEYMDSVQKASPSQDKL